MICVVVITVLISKVNLPHEQNYEGYIHLNKIQCFIKVKVITTLSKI